MISVTTIFKEQFFKMLNNVHNTRACCTHYNNIKFYQDNKMPRPIFS